MGGGITKGRILGIGGIFLKSTNLDQLRSWYSEHLGIEQESEGAALFKWRAHDNPELEQVTAWSIFPGESTYFEPSTAPFMINYIVDDLDAMLAKLRAQGVSIDPKREDYDYGRFAWIFDSDGNKIELWEPAAPPESSH
jgi:predicted enzyme related to lactoylglutathione lyase